MESGAWGGTCVNVGCVPKKVVWNAARVADYLRAGGAYGFAGVNAGLVDSFQLAELKKRRDAMVARLNNMYEKALAHREIELVEGWASFVGERSVSVAAADGSTRTLEAEHVIIATGSSAVELDVPGKEHVIDSDGFFELTEVPRRVAVIGAGYIATELAGMLAGLGADTTLIARRGAVLRTFDPVVQEAVAVGLDAGGVDLVLNSKVAAVERPDGGGPMALHLQDGRTLEGFDCVLQAIGRRPAVDALRLDRAGVETDGATGRVVVDDFQNSTTGGVYAIGDVANPAHSLTPVAIAAGRILVDRLFGGPAHAEDRLSYEAVPSVVFTRPPVGAVGLTEAQARERYGDDAVEVFTSSWVNLFYGVMEHKPRDVAKLVCVGDEQRVVGLHVVATSADEMLQGFAVAVKAGLTKAQFDACVAIHPTAAEEIVTMKPWAPALR